MNIVPLKILFNVTIFIGIVALFGFLFTDIVLYIIISLILATILRNPTNYISQGVFYGRRIPRTISIIVSFGLLVLFITLFIAIFSPLISEQVKVIKALNIDHLLYNLGTPVDEFEAYLSEHSIIKSHQKGFIMKWIKNTYENIFSKLNITLMLNEVLTVTSSIFIGLISVLFITFFLLKEKDILRKNILRLIPNNYFEITITAINKIETLLSNYLIGLVIQMVSIFTIVSIGLSLFGINYALSIALFAAVANLIPFLGPLIGAIFGIIVGISTSFNYFELETFAWMLIKIISVFGFVQLLDNIFLQPIIFSKSVKAHPLEIFIGIFMAAAIGGTIGMVVAIPTYTIIKVTINEAYKGFKQYRVFYARK